MLPKKKSQGNIDHSQNKQTTYIYIYTPLCKKTNSINKIETKRFECQNVGHQHGIS